MFATRCEPVCVSSVQLPPPLRHYSMIRWITAWSCLGCFAALSLAYGHSHHERTNHRRPHGSRRAAIDLLDDRLEDNFHPVLPPGQAPADPNKPFGKTRSGTDVCTSNRELSSFVHRAIITIYAARTTHSVSCTYAEVWNIPLHCCDWINQT